MALSGIHTGTMTAAELVTSAMQELGVLAIGEVPEGAELEIGLRSLNWLLKSWTARGLTSWRETQGSATFSAAQVIASLASDVLDVTEARLIITASAPTYERPLQRWEDGQYRQIPNKQTPGQPTAYLITKTITGASMTVWPVPNASMTIAFTYSRIPDDVTDGAQTIDLPQQWTEACYLGLAARLAQVFGVTHVDPNTAKFVVQRASALEALLFDDDRPASLYMGSAMGRNF